MGAYVVDYDPMTFAGNPFSGWSYHFNWHYNAIDDLIGFIGGDLIGYPEARQLEYDARRSKALSFIRQMGEAGCASALYSYGYGLHALQDIYAHMYLTPAEHSHYNSHPDDVDYVSLGTIRWAAYKSGNSTLSKLTYNGLKAYYGLKGLAGITVREFNWKRVGRLTNPRVIKTEARTREELIKLLWDLWNTNAVFGLNKAPCVNRSKKPPKHGQKCP